MSLSKDLYALARLSRDWKAASKGPGAITRRVGRKMLGRALARGGFWRFLWR